MKLSLTETGVSDLQRRLKGLAEGLDNPKGFVEMGRLLSERAIRRNFNDQKDSKGRSWPKLKTRPGGVPFQKTSGRMPKGITSRPFPRGWEVAAGSATKAFNAVHNFGSKMWLNSGGKKGNPQRQYMFFSKAAVKQIAEQLKIYVSKLVKK